MRKKLTFPPLTLLESTSIGRRRSGKRRSISVCVGVRFLAKEAICCTRGAASQRVEQALVFSLPAWIRPLGSELAASCGAGI